MEKFSETNKSEVQVPPVTARHRNKDAGQDTSNTIGGSSVTSEHSKHQTDNPPIKVQNGSGSVTVPLTPPPPLPLPLRPPLPPPSPGQLQREAAAVANRRRAAPEARPEEIEEVARVAPPRTARQEINKFSIEHKGVALGGLLLTLILAYFTASSFIDKHTQKPEDRLELKAVTAMLLFVMLLFVVRAYVKEFFRAHGLPGICDLPLHPLLPLWNPQISPEEIEAEHIEDCTVAFILLTHVIAYMAASNYIDNYVRGAEDRLQYKGLAAAFIILLAYYTLRLKLKEYFCSGEDCDCQWEHPVHPFLSPVQVRDSVEP